MSFCIGYFHKLMFQPEEGERACAGDGIHSSIDCPSAIKGLATIAAPPVKLLAKLVVRHRRCPSAFRTHGLSVRRRS